MRRALLPMLSCAAAFAAAPVSIGGKLDAIEVRDLSGKSVTIEAGTVTAVIFLSVECPVSNEYNDRMTALYRDYFAKGVRFVFVDANRNESDQAVMRHREAAGFPFPVYRDPANRLADELGAEVTPQTFIFDGSGTLRYRGQIDDSRNPARIRSQGFRAAVEEVLAGKAVTRAETKAFGCTVKRVRKAS